jgi:hypothetical protein
MFFLLQTTHKPDDRTPIHVSGLPRDLSLVLSLPLFARCFSPLSKSGVNIKWSFLAEYYELELQGGKHRRPLIRSVGGVGKN